MTLENNKQTDEAQIRALIHERINAVRAKDVDGAMFSVSPDILSFDVVNPLQTFGSDGMRKRAAQWFSGFKGAIGYDLRDLSIATGNDVAFSHSLNRVNGTTTDGQKLDMWWRSTVCYRKLDGKWMVTHEHNSVPFDPTSGKASLDLKP